MTYTVRIASLTICSFVVLLQAGCNTGATPSPSPPPADVSKFDSYEDRIEAQGGRVSVQLDFSNSEMTDGELAKVHVADSVTSIDLAGTKITDAGLTHLKQWPNLNSVNLTNTEITDAGLATLKELPNLTQVLAVHAKLSREGQVELMKFLAARRREAAAGPKL